jgi:NAD(P)-dependent dehydrogenase (short-subunit alcohol dehydrogenase family)
VVGTSRDTARLASRNGVSFLDLDVSSDESVTAAVQQVIDRYARIDVLVNNAGIGVHTMRRLVPSRMFDQQLRKLNRLPG